MRKFGTIIFVALMAACVLSLGGCGGDGSDLNSTSGDNTGGNGETTDAVVQVAALNTPAFQIGESYTLWKGATLDGMDSNKYFVAYVGGEEKQAVMNLGFTQTIGTSNLVVKDASENVVFVYNPSGTGTKTAGTVTATGGTQLQYNGLEITSVSGGSVSSAMKEIDTSNMIVIQLNGDSATIGSSTVPVYDYVWHADPDHAAEYWTKGSTDTTPIYEDDYDDIVDTFEPVSNVYIARDIRYMTSDITFTGTATKDGEQEYVAYYSATVSAEVAAETGFSGPFIFATLPGSMGMGGPGDKQNGGQGGQFGGDPNGQGGKGGQEGRMGGAATSLNDSIAAYSTMTHTATEAYANPVLHITGEGVYMLQGTWHGQIWIEAGKKEVALILNGVEVSCDVAPALVFRKTYECGHADTYDPDADDDVTAAAVRALMVANSDDVGAYVAEKAGAVVLISDDTTNSFTGANVYRILKPTSKDSTVTQINGTDISAQKKMYKMDGAFYSFRSLLIGGGDKGTGKLNITSTTYEGLDSEMHMTIESGIISVSAEDDGINTNEDNISVFTMRGGELTVYAPNGDGIDSNGWIAIMSADKLTITANGATQPTSRYNVGTNAEGALDADLGVYMSESAWANYTVTSGRTNTNQNGNNGTPIVDNTVGRTDYATFTTDKGTTAISFDIGASSISNLVADPYASTPRTVPESDKVFKLERKVNTFSKIKAAE